MIEIVSKYDGVYLLPPHTQCFHTPEEKFNLLWLKYMKFISSACL